MNKIECLMQPECMEDNMIYHTKGQQQRGKNSSLCTCLCESENI